MCWPSTDCPNKCTRFPTPCNLAHDRKPGSADRAKGAGLCPTGVNTGKTFPFTSPCLSPHFTQLVYWGYKVSSHGSSSTTCLTYDLAPVGLTDTALIQIRNMLPGTKTPNKKPIQFLTLVLQHTPWHTIGMNNLLM